MIRRPKFDKILKKADKVHHQHGHGFEAEVACYNYIKSALPDEFERGLYNIFVYCHNVFSAVEDGDLEISDEDIEQHMNLAGAIYNEYDDRRKLEVDSSYTDQSRSQLYPIEMVTDLRAKFTELFEDDEPKEEDFICPECAKVEAEDNKAKKHLH